MKILKNKVVSIFLHKEKEFRFASAKMKRVVEMALLAAKKNVKVLLTGETGAGKELFARYIHENSMRSDKPFIAAPVCSMPKELLESLLFGHVKGSFTSALRDHIGLFEEADGATIFLDEVGDIPLEVQVKLLRILQENEIQPVGGPIKKVDVRVIAATNRDLRELMRKGLFREDLFYRLSSIELSIPPLRERPEDILFLSDFLLKQKCFEYGENTLEFTKDAKDLLLGFRWPGNVRELENVIDRAVVFGAFETIDAGELLGLYPEFASSAVAKDVFRPTCQASSLEKSEKALILNALEKSLWVQKEAAVLLGITGRTMNYKIRKLGITHKNWIKNK
jgi:transcriptional regulator with GAF, ATPase, and Fis domain